MTVCSYYYYCFYNIAKTEEDKTALKDKPRGYFDVQIKSEEGKVFII